MFRKVLIANRGEIAVRIAATCQAMGIVAVAVYSDADAGALHVRSADEAYPIGPAAAAHSYLNVEAIIGAARRAHADAIHPGYGFLSENPLFAEACRTVGITFVGPSAEAMRLLGSKSAAKQVAQSVDVPIVPGYHEQDQSDSTLLAQAEVLGTPLLIKAAAGGGGRGMRTVRNLEEFPEALAAARREARAAFDDDTMLLERLIERPRHVEVQVLGDQHGALVHLGERECSIQRRHQKIIEEAPSPAVSPDLRAEIGTAAIRIARAASYTNAGTVEFLISPDGTYYFLETNTRLQVEHPITELITGFDLVALQLRVAAGEPLPFSQDDVMLHGHALECRLYAEDPAATFLPSTGRLAVFAPPHGPGIRIDAGVSRDDTVTVHYDPLLAKVITHAGTREATIARARWALHHFPIIGVVTNAAFLDRLLAHPAFAEGDLSTDFLERHMIEAQTPPLSLHRVLLLATLWQLTTRPDDAYATRDPWLSGSSWSAGITRTTHLAMDGLVFPIVVTRGHGTEWSVRVDDAIFDVTVVHRDPGGNLTLRMGSIMVDGHVVVRDGAIHVTYAGLTQLLRLAGPPDVDVMAHDASTFNSDLLAAPMPGTVLALYVHAGEHVETGQRLAILEAMKMEHAVTAPYAGVVRAVLHRQGDMVAAGERLVEIEAV